MNETSAGKHTDEQHAGSERLHKPADSGERPGEVPIIGLGASAGGLQAFTAFLDALPDDSGMAFVLIQHLDPEHESMMASLLSPHTGMTVLPAENGQRVVPNHVYVIPPKTTLLIEDNALRLTAPSEHHGARMPIDAFFRSLAAEREDKAIGIVLSGTGADGTLGLKAIKEVGGLALVQNPDEAAYDGMPRSAVASGAADHVLPVQDMPAALIGYVTQPYFMADDQDSVLGDRARDILPDVVAALKKRTLINFDLYKEGTLLRRIERRMGISHLGNGKAYLDLLKEDPDELDRLYKDLLINVTRFFRDAATVDYLATQVLPALVRDQAGDQAFRVWVAGCATGEEAYSIAILLIEQAEALGRRLKIQIFATDLDAEALAVARGGTYPESIEVDVSADRLRRFFIKEDHTYHVIPELRETVVFAEHNLLSDAPFSRLDMVTCRNVLIYLDPNIQGAIIDMFHFALNKAGILVLGTSETLSTEDGLFEALSREHRVYRQCGGRRRLPRADSPILSSHAPVGLLPARKSVSPQFVGGISRLTQRVLLERYAPAAVLLNRKYEALYFSGPIDRFIRVPVGEAGQDVLAMVREGLRGELRAIVQAALESGQSLKSESASVVHDDSRHRVIMHVEPLESGDETLLLVTFTDTGDAENTATLAEPGVQSIVDNLENQLESSRRELNVTIRDLEASNEELKASNEEAMSMNEEFQSTNEELETSREELQSLNEELTTLNTQLQQKVEEHLALVSDLNNLLNSAEIATIFLDDKLCIKRFTPSIRDLFNLIGSDVGRHFADITQKFDDGDLLQIATQVLVSHQPVDTEIESHTGRWYVRRVLPYRTLSNSVGGVVITFHDVTDLKKTQQSALAAQAYAEAIISTIREPLIVLDEAVNVVSANESFHAAFGTTADEAVGRSLFDLLGRRWDVAELRDALQRTISETVTLEEFELKEIDKGSGERTLSFNARRIDGQGIRSDLVLLTIEDVTERRLAERRIEEQNARLNSILESAQVGIVTSDEAGIINSFSKTAEGIFGYSAEEAIGQNLTLLMPDAERDTHVGYVAAYLDSGQSKIIGKGREVIGQHKNGRLIPLDLAVGEAHVKGSRLFTGVMRDITLEKKRQEELRQAQKMDAMGQLTGGVAHDFNNILTVILGNLELLSKERTAGDRNELITEAIEAVKLGSELTADLLAFGSRIAMRQESLDLNELVDHFSGMLRRTVPESIHIKTELQTALWPIVSDPVQIQNALLNLVLNARDAMPDGGTLTISTRNVTLDADYAESHADVTPGEHVALTVRDTGAGMTAEVLERAFEPFYTTKEVGQGTGLGLSTVYGLVKQSKGHATIDSQQGHGTTITLYLPRKDTKFDADSTQPGGESGPLGAKRTSSLSKTTRECVDLRSSDSRCWGMV